MSKDSKKNQEGQSFTKNFTYILKNDRISPLDKLVYAQIHSLAVNKGYCWATNQSLSEMLASTQRNIQYSITKLIDENLITRVLSNNERKLYIVEMSQPEVIPTKELAPPHEETCTPPRKNLHPPTKKLAPPHEETCTPPTQELAYIIDNRIDNLKDNKLDNIIDNNNTKNLDLVEGMEGVDNHSSTNTPEGGDIIPGNDDGNDIDFLIKPEIELTLEEKLEASKIKSSIKEEEFNIIQRNIEDVFSDYEIANALNF